MRLKASGQWYLLGFSGNDVLGPAASCLGSLAFQAINWLIPGSGRPKRDAG